MADHRNTRRVGFIVDHPKRDLPGGAMLALALGRQGIETALIPLYDQAVDVPLLGLDALVVNFARPVNLDLVRGYRSAGLPVWVLDTEGGVLADDGANSPDRMAAFIRESGFAQLLAGYFFWGQEQQRGFVRQSGMPEDSLHVTGNPRFDYAAPRWRDVLEYKSSGYILVNANFPLVNPLFAKSPEAERAALAAAGWSPKYVDCLIADSKRIFTKYLESVARLAKQFTDRRFLVRPHPFENPARYVEAFLGHANVDVDGRGSVLNVIRHAQCVLHLNCGTSIEALMLGKIPFSMEYLNTEFMSRHSSLPSRASWRVGSEEELATLLSDVPDAERRFDVQARYKELVAPWFYLNDGDAAERVAHVLSDRLQSSIALPPSVALSLRSSRLHPRPVQRVQAALANLLGSDTVSRLRAWSQPARKAKRLRLDEVAMLLSGLSAHEIGRPCEPRHARHPVSGTRLASVLIRPA